MKRYVFIWFRHLMTNRFVRKNPDYQSKIFVLAANRSGRRIVTASSASAERLGIQKGMAIADVRAMYPSLEVIEDPDIPPFEVLKALGEWAIQFTPLTAVELPDGILLDATGCTHLWGGEKAYLKDIVMKFRGIGYDVRVGMAGTPGVAQAIARYGEYLEVVPIGKDKEALLNLPPDALQLSSEALERLYKLGLTRISQFIDIPKNVLRRRFGSEFTTRLDQILGILPDYKEPVELKEPFKVNLSLVEPLRTATAIRIAIEKLIDRLCDQLLNEGKGLQRAVLKTIRLDGKEQELAIMTHQPTCHKDHLLKLFDLKIPFIEPDLGIESFSLSAPLVADMPLVQERIWSVTKSSDLTEISRLLDKMKGRGAVFSRYLPAEHHWPERSFRIAKSLDEKPAINWPIHRPRPILILPKPEMVEVAAPIPDYPPIHFRYKGKLHTIRKADGPERIEQEWWLEAGPHRDYYVVEDNQGARYWIFRSGHYDEKGSKWFIHGFFA